MGLWPLLIATLMYLWTSLALITQKQYAMAGVFLAYAIANCFLALATYKPQLVALFAKIL